MQKTPGTSRSRICTVQVVRGLCLPSGKEAVVLRIIGLKAYRKGYTGFLENEEAYVFFNTFKGQYRPVQTYPKKDFESFHHFTTLMSKFATRAFFLKIPVEIAAVDMETLDRVHTSLTPSTRN